MKAIARAWPEERLTRVPYWVYQYEDICRREQQRIFRGPSWSFLCLEAELPAPESFRTTFIGDMPVVVTRDSSGALHAFENRCAHHGAAPREHLRAAALPPPAVGDAGRASRPSARALGLALPGRAHHARRRIAAVRLRALSGPDPALGRARRAAVRGKSRGVRQPALRHAARDPAVGEMGTGPVLLR